ncbi:N-acetylmuramoyl-L-alanine amidase [Modestobacter sp. VKM Ac-2977]|uniref:peptidoglycan recognition protein family protein n=1 Tax=Modestobacter sp. VKM Ac-2977 TaxID=3004131 RepID=UPI0022AAC2E2|nr:N-acetylmuramoyl-L-alanine amidase [Modestobacter sp. VKM Ac-2977]MCZ2822337.1 N-acetylmuramoyl-L-alanine amidase [Modestobacter sp. VKM Ac-2977]
MRRLITGSLAFVTVTATLLVLPVYASPGPDVRPVETSIDEVALGSVTDPAEDAVVATDGEVQPGGVTEAEATATVPPRETADPTAAEPAEPTESTEPTEVEPTEAEPTGTEPTEAGAVPDSGAELSGVPALTVSLPETDSFSSVGITWRQDPAVTDVVTRVRVRDEDGAWGSWTTLEPDDIEQTATAETEDNDVRGGTAPYWTGPARGVEVIVQGAGGAVPEDVSVALLDPGTSEADALPESGATDEAQAGTVMPDVVTRSQWGADESIRTWGAEYASTLKAATIHHTADGNGYSAEQVPAMMRSIYAYHAKTRGWGDIGYNVIVDKFGRIFEGRYGGLSSTVVGAHAGGFNTGTFGVSMLGNYAEVDTPQAMLDSVAAVIAWKLGMYGVDPNGQTTLTAGGGSTSRYKAGDQVTLPTVFAHRDVGLTACPGVYAYNRMGQIRALVTQRMVSLPGGSPVGNLEEFSLKGSTVSVSGWVLDPDYPAGVIDLAILVDGNTGVHLPASQNRPDVAAAVPGAGPGHGFQGTYTLSRGRHNVCAVAVNAAPSGLNTWMACKVMTATAPSAPPPTVPFGNVEFVSVTGRTISAQGWAIDPDALTTPLDVHVYVDDGWGGLLVAKGVRPDVGAAYPAAGPAHGFTWSTTVSAPGPHTVCLFAINENAGTDNTKLGCSTVTVAPALWDPQGRADSVAVRGHRAEVSGWALDLDTAARPVLVHLYVDGEYAGETTAGGSRPDVGRIFPGAGDAHGFSAAVDVPPGAHTVCSYAINVGHGANNPSLGCLPVAVDAVSWNPVGSLDWIDGSGGTTRAGGWAWDPDRGAAPTEVHLYLDGGWAGAVTATGDRPDVAAAYPAAGAAHGYWATVAVPAGRHQLCAYAIDSGHGTTNPLLGCKQVVG